VAVIAIYPKSSSGYVASLRNLVMDMYELDYTLLIVSNGPISAEVKAIFTDKSKTILGERLNFGRDFGAYQSAIFWLQKNSHLGRLESLFIFNDTLLWGSDNKRILKWHEMQEWGCIYLNQERHTHAQSFALHFSHSIINSTAFKQYWRKYLPLNQRRHAIHAGEIALSSTLIRAGFDPKAYVNLNLFSDAKRIDHERLEYAARLPIAGIFPSNQVGSPAAFDPKNNWLDLNDGGTAKIRQEELLRWLSQYSYSDAPHRIGLHLCVLFEVPMKRDMYKFHLLPDIKETLELFSPEYASEYFDDLVQTANRFMVGDRQGRSSRLNGEI
jgi:hypothetical protein